MIGGMASCAFCDADLSGVANKDGRAEELKNIVAYSCPQCLPYDDHVRGRAIGGFNLVRRLGEGGMGVVYLAHHTLTGRLVALKQIKGLQDEYSVKRFERESLFMQAIVHENIVRCLHTGTHSEGPYFVSEFVPDGDLEQLVEKEGGKLPPDRATAIISQVLAGICYLHTKDIVHRDIKPQNILVRSSAGQPDLIKLTDFGLAKCHSQAGGVRLTKPKTAMGTLMYMPPEQIKDAAGVRAPADLYAVGVTLYYILTGSYTFNFPTPAEVAALQRQKPEQFKSPEEVLGWIMRANRVKHPFLIILNEDPVPILDRNTAVPRRLADAVDKAVQKEPEKRFGSAADFQKALRESV
jgi:serine/threonine-protein kinase